jgi:sporulation protein YlmC with PRC-barrel domain
MQKTVLLSSVIALGLAASHAHAQQQPTEPQAQPRTQGQQEQATQPPAEDQQMQAMPPQAREQPAQQQAQPQAQSEPQAQGQQMVSEDKFLSAQTQNQWLSTEIIGQQVQNQAGEALGEVQYLVFDESNRIAAAVIGVGGFLGIGEKSVAINFDAMSRRRTDEGVELLAKVDEGALDAAPSFETTPAATAEAPAEQTTAPETAPTQTDAQPAEAQKQAEK